MTFAPVEIAVGCEACGANDRYRGAPGDVEYTAELFFTAHRQPVLLEVTFTGPGGTWRRVERKEPRP